MATGAAALLDTTNVTVAQPLLGHGMPGARDIFGYGSRVPRAASSDHFGGSVVPPLSGAGPFFLENGGGAASAGRGARAVGGAHQWSQVCPSAGGRCARSGAGSTGVRATRGGCSWLDHGLDLGDDDFQGERTQPWRPAELSRYAPGPQRRGVACGWSTSLPGVALCVGGARATASQLESVDGRGRQQRRSMAEDAASPPIEAAGEPEPEAAAPGATTTALLPPESGPRGSAAQARTKRLVHGPCCPPPSPR